MYYLVFCDWFLYMIGFVSLRVPLRAFSTWDCTGPGDGYSVGLIFLLTDGSSALAISSIQLTQLVVLDGASKDAQNP